VLGHGALAHVLQVAFASGGAAAEGAWEVWCGVKWWLVLVAGAALLQ
jgi:hypothetical protein